MEKDNSLSIMDFGNAKTDISQHTRFKAPKPSVTAYTAFKGNSSIRKMSSFNEKPLQY